MRKIQNIRLPSPKENSLDDDLWCLLLDENDCVSSLQLMQTDISDNLENWGGDWLSPMGVDLQINGGLGLSFVDLKPQEIPKILNLLDQLWSDGVDAICPTLVSCDISSLRNSLEILNCVRKEKTNNRCKLLGAHLEGPFLSIDYVGAHDINSLCKPSLSALEKRIKGFEKEIALVTLAPELIGSLEIIKKLETLDIVVSLGHSAANEETSSFYFKNGVSMITHTFNAMKPIHHRDPGPIGAAVSNGETYLGLIADGVHIHPKVAEMLYMLSSNKIVLVSDALAPYGLHLTKYQWDKRDLFVENGICRLNDGTLVGTTIPLLEGCRRFAKWTQDASASIWSATVAPRLVLKKNKSIKDFLVGKNLKTLLRWKVNSGSDDYLTWHPAA